MSRVFVVLLGLVVALPCLVGESVSAGTGETPQNEPNLITFSRIDKAWKYTQGENTKVAVLDWLFDMSPKASAKYINPTSMIPGEKIGFAEAWHGEWMAEIVHQIAPKAKIIPIRARPVSREQDRDKDGRMPYEKYLVKGIRFAADQYTLICWYTCLCFA